jgi:hypothetical protein
MGLSNLVAGHVLEREQAGSLLIGTSLGRLRVPDATFAATAGDRVTLVIRPEAAAVVQNGTTDRTNRITGTVVQLSFRGSRSRVTIQPADGQALEFEIDEAIPLRVGEPVTLELRSDAISLISEVLDA